MYVFSDHLPNEYSHRSSHPRLHPLVGHGSLIYEVRDVNSGLSGSLPNARQSQPPIQDTQGLYMEHRPWLKGGRDKVERRYRSQAFANVRVNLPAFGKAFDFM